MSATDMPGVEVRIEPTDDPLTYEVGSTGLRNSGGIIDEEFLTQLRGEKGYQVYREMRENEPTINGLLFAIEMLVRQADMSVRPVDETDPDALAVAEFVRGCFDDMSHSWADAVTEVMSMLPYGWAALETVYKRRNGVVPGKPGESSKFDDGMIGWRKLPIRSQETLDRWLFDDNDGIQGMVQGNYFSAGTGSVQIPIQKMLLFRTTQHKGNPEGRSILRGAYRPWFYKRRIEEIEAVGIERELAGMPMIEAPVELFRNDASDDLVALRQKLLKTLRNIRRDEQDGLLFPRQLDENGNELYRFSLVASGGKRDIRTDEVLKRKMNEIALTVLADFILLGHEGVGSFALSRDKTSLFATALDAYLDSVADVFNRHGIPRLLMLNGIPLQLAPEMTFEPVRAPTLTEIAEFIKQLADSGAPFFPDRNLENWLRERAGIPPIEDEGELAAMPEPSESVTTSGDLVPPEELFYMEDKS